VEKAQSSNQRSNQNDPPPFPMGEVASLRAGGGEGHAEPNHHPRTAARADRPPKQDCTGSSPKPDGPALSRFSAHSTPTRLLDRMSSSTDSPPKLVESVARDRCHAPVTDGTRPAVLRGNLAAPHAGRSSRAATRSGWRRRRCGPDAHVNSPRASSGRRRPQAWRSGPAQRRARDRPTLLLRSPSRFH
jgi:hypothetical protein